MLPKFTCHRHHSNEAYRLNSWRLLHTYWSNSSHLHIHWTWSKRCVNQESISSSDAVLIPSTLWFIRATHSCNEAIMSVITRVEYCELSTDLVWGSRGITTFGVSRSCFGGHGEKAVDKGKREHSMEKEKFTSNNSFYLPRWSGGGQMIPCFHLYNMNKGSSMYANPHVVRQFIAEVLSNTCGRQQTFDYM